MSDNSEKILVRYYSDVLEEMTVETLWTEIIDIQKGLYKIDNIPFMVRIFLLEILFLQNMMKMKNTSLTEML